jgi:hypothetical protein
MASHARQIVLLILIGIEIELGKVKSPTYNADSVFEL